jgi:pyruvate/2-oxoglutarate/acetoin dehydrogenase E1 component/TPP-dependent pyruvate/acetoin dehydrogenase alpha subunit
MNSIAENAPVNKVENEYAREVLTDFWLCCVSREASLLSRKEVLTGKAKFGITGDGKEVPQVAMARAWKKGDFRSGYYRDQTLMFALGLSTVEDYFAQLYSDVDNDPFSSGRQMNSHFATPLINEKGEWLDHTRAFNSSSDISPTGGQMARSLGLALASKLYRSDKEQFEGKHFSDTGSEICFCTIGDASTSEGIFWETVNAACVLKVPLAISVWDDGYGISVPIDYQTTKKNISKALKGFKINSDGEGMHMYKAKAWDYAALVEMYITGAERMRKDHTPALFHVEEVTQPQGHSTSGSHERYKSKERLEFEQSADCIEVMFRWIIDNELASTDFVNEIREHAVKYARNAKKNAYENYRKPIVDKWKQFKDILRPFIDQYTGTPIANLIKEFNELFDPEYAEIISLARKIDHAIFAYSGKRLDALHDSVKDQIVDAKNSYARNLYAEGKYSALSVPIVAPEFSEHAPMMSGYQILNQFFDRAMEEMPELIAFGEDVGKIGDVNQGFAGIQEKYGELKVFDTGIREWSIVGQAIGLAMRGFRPIAEIQYLDYLIYGISALSDDLSTLRYRSNGLQQAPAIIRTRGHRLEGIWHAGSPLGMILNSLRGMYVLVPRNMTVAAGFYNTLLQSNDPALVIESLNGYRLKERMPENIGEYTLPLGVPEILRRGKDLTLVTYGSLVRIAEGASQFLEEHLGIDIELIDLQSLLPFDLEHRILESVKKTNRLLIVDEDVPGGASAFILQKILEEQKAYFYLDSAPATLTSAEHRPPYGSDGDYFTKPNAEDIVDKVIELMHS